MANKPTENAMPGSENAEPVTIIDRFLIAFDLICSEEKKKGYEIAESVNISPPVISQLRKGQVKTIQAEYVKNLCLTYNYSIIWMMTGEGEMKADNDTITMQQDISKMKKDIVKILELQRDVVGPLINEILGIKIGPIDVSKKLIGEVKRHTKLNS